MEETNERLDIFINRCKMMMRSSEQARERERQAEKR